MVELLPQGTQFQARDLVNSIVKDPQIRSGVFMPLDEEGSVRADVASRLSELDSVQTGRVLTELLSGIADAKRFTSANQRHAAVGIVALLPVDRMLSVMVKDSFTTAVRSLAGSIRKDTDYPEEQVMDLLDAGVTIAPYFPKHPGRVRDLRSSMQSLTKKATPEEAIYPNVQIEEILTRVTGEAYIPDPVPNEKGIVPQVSNPTARHAVLSVFYANPEYPWTIKELVDTSGIPKSTLTGIIYRNGIKLGYKGTQKPQRKTSARK